MEREDGAQPTTFRPLPSLPLRKKCEYHNLQAPGLLASQPSSYRILGFAMVYSTSVSRFTSTYVSPTARMHPCTSG